MGNIFPLSKKPSCLRATIELIERSFQYQGPNSFEIDFAPLIDKSNHENCFIMIDDKENVLAHIGAKDRTITVGNEKFTITMLGGIAVDEKHRGAGHFQTLLQDVLAEKRSDTTLFLLWSDKEKLYNKFGFHLCGTQYEIEVDKKTNDFTKTTYAELSPNEKLQIQSLYKDCFAKNYLTVDRNQNDWQLIEKITSADLFIKKSAELITDYYFMNKGQDLPEIIYEYAGKGELKELVTKLSHYGKVWMGKPIIDTENVQYQFFMAPGDLRLFTEFVSKLTDGKIAIRNINPMTQEVFFDFNEELHGLDVDDFLRGIFGPGVFEELELPSLYISGLESI